MQGLDLDHCHIVFRWLRLKRQRIQSRSIVISDLSNPRLMDQWYTDAHGSNGRRSRLSRTAASVVPQRWEKTSSMDVEYPAMVYLTASCG